MHNQCGTEARLRPDRMMMMMMIIMEEHETYTTSFSKLLLIGPRSP